MATNEKIKSDIQRLDVGSALVDLWSIDTTFIGGSIYYITPMTEEPTAVAPSDSYTADDGLDTTFDPDSPFWSTSGTLPVRFNGRDYLPLPLEVTGMEVIGDGRLPRPRLKVANVGLTFVGLLNAHNDAVGSKVTRIRTFQKYIDGHSEADANAQFPADVFFIEQKITQNKYMIEFELVSPLDIGNTMLPRLQTTSYCSHRYRLFKDGGFNYTTATCPYVGAGCFNSSGEATTADLDKCGKKLSDCELRFSLATDVLPFKGFPMIGQIGRAYL
jgi:lambda family phage minor tail protein L